MRKLMLLVSAFMVALAVPVLAQNRVVSHVPTDENVAEANVFMNAKLIAIQRDQVEIRDNDGKKRTLALADKATVESHLKPGNAVLVSIREDGGAETVVGLRQSVAGGTRAGRVVNAAPVFIPASPLANPGVDSEAAAQAAFITGGGAGNEGVAAATSYPGVSAYGGGVPLTTLANGNVVNTTNGTSSVGTAATSGVTTSGPGQLNAPSTGAAGTVGVGGTTLQTGANLGAPNVTGFDSNVQTFAPAPNANGTTMTTMPNGTTRTTNGTARGNRPTGTTRSSGSTTALTSGVPAPSTRRTSANTPASGATRGTAGSGVTAPTSTGSAGTTPTMTGFSGTAPSTTRSSSNNGSRIVVTPATTLNNSATGTGTPATSSTVPLFTNQNLGTTGAPVGATMVTGASVGTLAPGFVGTAGTGGGATGTTAVTGAAALPGGLFTMPLASVGPGGVPVDTMPNEGSATTIGSTQQPAGNAAATAGSLGADAAPLPIESAVRAYEATVARLSGRAVEVDRAFGRYKAACVGQPSVIGVPGAHEWFGIWDGFSTPSATGDQCEPLLATALHLGEGVQQELSAAEDMARRSGVLPGIMRQIRTQYGMDWDGWDR